MFNLPTCDSIMACWTYKTFLHFTVCSTIEIGNGYAKPPTLVWSHLFVINISLHVFFVIFSCIRFIASSQLSLFHTFRSSRTKIRFGVVQFLKTQDAETLTMLLQTRVFPMYAMRLPPPYVLANSNWLLGELAASLPEVRHHSQW